MNTPHLTNFGEYLLPLSVGLRTAPDSGRLIRYAGVAFFVRPTVVATCGHIVDQLGTDEMLVAQDLVSGQKAELISVQRHPKYDFALGHIKLDQPKRVLPLYSGGTLLGLDVHAFGFTADGATGTDLRILPRLFRGHIVGAGQNQPVPAGRSTLELSFPSLKGFSGAPLFASDGALCLAGMLYGNLESSIEQYSYTEIKEPGQVLTERVHKVLELGLAHSPQDISSFLIDLGIGTEA